MYHTHNLRIDDNTCNENSIGIKAHYCDNMTISDNICYNNDFQGIYVHGADNSIIIRNICQNNPDIGISAQGDNMTIEENTLNYNSLGMYFAGYDSIVDDNTFYQNAGIGMEMNSRSCNITNNLFERNGDYAIFLVGNAHNNSIHHNTFYNNNPGGTSQAKDDGNTNIWYDLVTSEGNYWDDWTGAGSYQLDGASSSVDPFPLSSPLIPPIPEFDLRTTYLLLLLLPLTLIIFKTRRRK